MHIYATPTKSITSSGRMMGSTCSINPNSPHNEFVFISDNYRRMLNAQLDSAAAHVSGGSDEEAMSRKSLKLAPMGLPSERIQSTQEGIADDNIDRGAIVSEVENVEDTSGLCPETEELSNEESVPSKKILRNTKEAQKQGNEWTVSGKRSFKPRRCKKGGRYQLRRSPRPSQSRV